MKKPSNLIYGLDDRPPHFIAFMLGMQHVCLLFISLIFPVVIVSHLGGSISPQAARGFVSISMIAGGLATIIQSLRKGPVGSGFLCPAVCGPSYLSASITAAQTGGMPALLGMTALAGFIESVLAPFMRRLRALFPAEVTGVVVAMVGMVLISLSVKKFFGISGADNTIEPREVFVAALTLVIMVGLNVWSRGKLRLFCTLIGMIAGYLFAWLLGIIPQASIEQIRRAEFIAFPRFHLFQWRMNLTLLIPFTIATLCSTMKTVGDLVTCQKINDADWKRPDMKNVAKGILADGLGGIIPGIIGGYGQSTSSSNVGLSIATGATSRIIAWFCGGTFIVLAFFPKLAQVFLIMPAPVMGATLIFAITFMIISGLQIISSRMMDARKTFVVGISLIFGLSADIAPQLYAGVHHWLKPVFESSLSLSTVMAIVLNLIMRIGIAKRTKIVLEVGKDSSDKLFEFLDKQGSLWGARREVMAKATSALMEFWESAAFLPLDGNSITIEAGFDELQIDLFITYKGDLVTLPSVKPTAEEMMSDENVLRRMSLYMMSRYADRIEISEKSGSSTLHLYFEH